jgi:hypothetical protein
MKVLGASASGYLKFVVRAHLGPTLIQKMPLAFKNPYIAAS